MPWDLLVFGTNLDASGGLVAQKLSAGTTTYSGNGAPGAATEVYPNEDGYITGFVGISEDGAMTELRFHITTDPNYIRTEHFLTGQGEFLSLNEKLGRCMYKVSKGDSITCDITNAAAKLDSVGLLIGRGSSKPKLYSEPPQEIPEGAMMVSATAAITCTADTWTYGDISFENYALRRDKTYTIYGASLDGATLQFGVFAAKTGPWAPYRPGIIASDDNAAQCAVFQYFSEPITFEGMTGLQLGAFASAGDTAQAITFLIKEN